MAGNSLVQQGGVEHGTGTGADLVEGGGHCDNAIAGDGAVGGLDANATGQRCGLADGPAGVSTQRQGCLEGGDGRCGATTGAAGGTVEGPGVTDYAEGRVLIGGAHGEFVEVGLAEDRHAGLAYLTGNGTVVGAHPAFEHARCRGGGLSFGDNEVLEGDGNTGQRGQFLASRTVCVDGCRSGEGLFGVEV